MSSALAIAGVTALLRDRLNDGLMNGGITDVTDKNVIVTALPPDRVEADGEQKTQLNVFLRQVSPNLGWRNEGLPSRSAAGTRSSNPPLALDLHYLIVAYGAVELHAEILLGYALALLHEHPVFTRDEIRRSLASGPDATGPLPSELRALVKSGLEHQAEPLRITPEYLSTEEMSKLWTATLAHYRLCAAFRVSVVLIQSEAKLPAPLPVLSRNIRVVPSPLRPFPTLERVVLANGLPVARLGTSVDIMGHALGGTGREVRLVNERFGVDLRLPPSGSGEPGADRRLTFELSPTLADTLPVGVYHVSVVVPAPGGGRETNRLALTLAPTLTKFPDEVERAADGSASIEVEFLPGLREGQMLSLLVGPRELPSPSIPILPGDPPPTSATFVLADAPEGEHPLRIRIDGIEALDVDQTQNPPGFASRVSIL